MRPRDEQRGERRQFVPRDELLDAFQGAPPLEYEELRADIDAYVDPSPWSWDDWEAWADRHFHCDSTDEDSSKKPS